jgi:hypothetical protein
VDAEGGPVAGAEVELDRARGGARRGPQIMVIGGEAERPPVESAADGSFEIRGVPGGDHVLTVTKRGFATERVDPLRIEPGRIPLRLHRADAVLDRRAEVEVERIVDAGGCDRRRRPRGRPAAASG